MTSARKAPGEFEPRTGALVIGDGYSALGAIRSLGRHGIPVIALTQHLGAASASRYTTQALPWPKEQGLWLNYLLDLGDRKRLDGWVLYPTEDHAMSLIARNHAHLSKLYRLITPPWDLVRTVHDKWLLHQFAGGLGIIQPWTVQPASREQLQVLDCPFPVILKPAVKESTNPFTRARAWRADGPEALLSLYEDALTMVPASSIMVQEEIPGIGNDYAYAALAQSGQPAASITVWRPRQYPIKYGRSSTYVETVDLPEIEEVGRKLIASLKLSGLVHVGFKQDPRDGRYKLLDVNTRIWSSQTLGRQAGLDFAYLQWRLVHGEPLPSDLRAPPGLRWIQLVSDLWVVFQLLRRKKITASDYLRSFAGPLEFAAFAWDDPLPALAGLPLIRRRSWASEVLSSATEHLVDSPHAPDPPRSQSNQPGEPRKQAGDTGVGR